MSAVAVRAISFLQGFQRGRLWKAPYPTCFAVAVVCRSGFLTPSYKTGCLTCSCAVPFARFGIATVVLLPVRNLRDCIEGYLASGLGLVHSNSCTAQNDVHSAFATSPATAWSQSN